MDFAGTEKFRRLPALRYRDDALPASTDRLIIDCTSIPRFGLRGPGACEWFAARGMRVPSVMNDADVDADGCMTLRLGNNEIMASGLSRVTALEHEWSIAEGPKGYDGFRADTWAHILISGPDADEFLAQFTDVDLRSKTMPVGKIAQTRALHLDVVMVRTDRLGVTGYELFFDVTSKAYVLDALAHLSADYKICTLSTQSSPDLG